MTDRPAEPSAGAARVAGSRAPARARRTQLTGRYFAISWERPAGPAQSPTPPESSTSSPTRTASAGSRSFGPAASARPAAPMMAVPKKLVPSSPLRNAIRRVLREAVRAAGFPPLRNALVRLVALPVHDEAAAAVAPGGAGAPGAPGGAGAPGAAGAPGTAGTAAGAQRAAPKKRRPVRPFERRLPDGALKRAVRADADALLARAVRQQRG